MKYLLLVALLVISAVNAVQSEQEIFAELSKQNEFGKALTSYIQLQAKTQVPSGRLKAINDELQKIKNTIDEQIVKEKDRIELKRIDCQTNLDELTSQISRLQTTQDDNNGEKTALDQELRDKTILVNEKRDALTSDQRNLEEYKGQLQDAQTKFSQSSANFADAIQQCESALNLLRQIILNSGSHQAIFAQNGQMLVQLSQKFDKIKKMLEESTKGSQTAFIEPIIDVLVQIGTSQHIDTVQVQQIIDLIERLITRLKQGLSNEQSNIQSQITSFNTLIDQLTSQTRTQTTQIQTLEERITAIQQRVNDLEKTISNTQEVISVTTSLKNSLIEDCQTQENIFREGDLQRKGQSEILAKLIKYFNDQIVSSTTNVNDEAYNDSLGGL